MQIKLKFVSAPGVVAKGMIMVKPDYPAGAGDEPMLDPTKIKVYEITDGFAVIDLPDSHAIQVQGEIVSSKPALLHFTREFTDSELVADVAEINLDDLKEVTVQAKPGTKFGFSFSNSTSTNEVEIPINGEVPILTEPCELLVFTRQNRLGIRVNIALGDPQQRVVVLTQA